MKKKYIDKYGNIWTKSVKDGLVFCTKYGYGLYDNGNGLTPLNNNYMLTPISTKIEEFKEKVGMLVLEDMEKFEKEVGEHPGVMDIEDMISERGSDFLRTALEQRDEEVRQTLIHLARKKTQEFNKKGLKSNHFVPLSLGEITDALGLDKYDECAECHGGIITKSKENN